MAKTSLLDLPPEIWSKICKLAVEEQTPIKIFTAPDDWHGNIASEGKLGIVNANQPPITLVCRIIREDFLDHYYKSNIFYGVTVPEKRCSIRRPDDWHDVYNLVRYGCPVAPWTRRLDACLQRVGKTEEEAMGKILIVHNARGSFLQNVEKELPWSLGRGRMASEDEIGSLADGGVEFPVEPGRIGVYCLELGLVGKD